MVRLIVQEGGERRGFKVGQGKLSIGSGQGAKLRLADPNVAELHAELEVSDGRAVLRTKPGVQPALKAGVPQPSEFVLEHGVPIDIGATQLVVEYEGLPPVQPAEESAPAAPAQAAPAQPAPRAAAGSRAPARGVQRTARGGSSAASGRSRADDSEPSRRASSYRDRKQKESSMLLVGLLVGVPLIAFLGWRLLGSVTGQVGAQPEWQAEHRLTAARDFLADSAYARASEALDQAAEDPDLSADERRQIQELRDQVAAGQARGRQAAHNMAGNDFLDTRLKAYEKNWLQDKPDHARMRLFLIRLEWFKSEYPTHDEMDWVDRQIRRFEPLVDLSQPPSWADIEFEAKMAAALTQNRITREVKARGDANWKEAFRVLDSYLQQAEGADREAALLLVDDLRTRRDAWVIDKLQQAKFHYDNAEAANWDSGELGSSIAWLVKIIRFSDDPEAERDAAQRILQYESVADLAAFMRGYKSGNPDRFDDLKNNAVLGPYLEQQGILD